MTSLANHTDFQADYNRLKTVSLNPDRHTADTAFEHCQLVRQRAADLAALNGCTAAETALLDDLACVHDIGKITGTANPVESVALLPKYGITDEHLTNLVKYHDTNLPWHLSVLRGESPSDKAWNKLARKVDMRLLCLFMVADRADCPGGWRANAPLVWFLEEARRRGLVPGDLVLDAEPVSPPQSRTQVNEVSAGVVLVQRLDGASHASLIRMKQETFELPKGHVEPGETTETAALRELHEESGLITPVEIGPQVGSLAYTFSRRAVNIAKHVHYFAAIVPDGVILNFGPLPRATRELRWVTAVELDTVPLVSAELRPLIVRALELADADQMSG